MKIKKMKKLLFATAPLAIASIAIPVVIASQAKRVQSSNTLKTKASVIAPLAMRVNPHNGDLAAFISKLNDAATDAKYEAMLLDSANQNLIKNSNFYKTSLVSFKPGTYTFGTSDITTLIDKIVALSKSTEFTDDQKVMVGKWMLAKYSFTNFFTYKGLPVGKSFTQNEIEAGHAGNLVNPITNAALSVGGTQIKVVGETGINTSWRAKNANDNVYNISNQGVLEYGVAAWANSSEFKKLIDDFNNDTALHKTNPVDMSWKQVFINYVTNSPKASSVFTDLALPGVNLPGVFSSIDASKLVDDDKTFATIVSSPIGLALYGNDAAKAVADYFTGDSTVRNSQFEDLTNRILAVLNPLNQKAQNYFANVETNGTDTTNDDVSSQEMIKFAKLLLSYSNSLSSDAQVRVINDEFINSQRGILIKTGHNPGAWSKIANGTISIDKIVASSSVEKTVIDYINYAGDGNVTEQLTPIFKTTKQKTVDGPLATLTTLPEQVWHTGEERWGYLNLSLHMNGADISLTGSTVSMLIDDHDDDNRFKNVNIIKKEVCNSSSYYPTCSLEDTYSDPIPWKVTVPSGANSTWTWSEQTQSTILVNDANIHFMWSNDNTENTARAFDSLKESIASEIETEKQYLDSQVAAWKNNPSLNQNYDPTANASYKITLKDITFDKILYQTYDDSGYDDTHANNFRFSGIHYTFDEEIDQKFN